jgi:hypothetical protein
LSGQCVFKALAVNKAQKNSGGGKQKEEALGNSRAPPYCFNVNRTSQDHLLLGGNADVDKSVEWTEYNAGRFQSKSFLKLWVLARQAS